MKKVLATIISCILLLGILSIGVYAAAPVFSLTGPGTIRAGNNIKVSVNVNGSGLLAVMGQINFDSAKLTYNSTADNLSGWAIDIEQSSGKITFIAIDDKLAAPINSNKTLFSINFTVKSTVAAGETISVSTSNLEVSDGTNDFTPSNASFSKIIAQPLSVNNNLNSLTVSNVDISPAFSAGTITYSATVPFSVNSLSINTTLQDSKSSVAISGNSLRVGSNSVVITVTAENGSKKTYTITVTREQDPNYEASNNSNLKSLVPSKGILSPVFDPDKNLYYVYLPVEIEVFDASAEMQDAKAQGVEKEQITLNVGENEFTIKGIAEDGTEKTYTIKVVRMPAAGEEMPEPTATPTVDPQESKQDNSFTISGRIVDENNNPLANKIVELHSEPMITRTDSDGYYKFENVTPGEHTLYVKDEDGSQIATMPLKVTYGSTTSSNGEEIVVEGNTTLDLKVTQTGIEIKNIAKYQSNPIAPTNESKGGMPWWGILLIAIISAGAGFLIRHILPNNKINEVDSKIYF